MSDIENVQQAQAFITGTFGYTIQDLNLIQEAIDTTGLCRVLSTQANKRLAMIGDKALGISVVSEWYRTGAPRESCTTQLQTRLSNDNLANVTRQIGLDRHLILHPGHIGPVSRKTLATGLEAVFGAIYQDCGDQISIIRDAMQLVGI